MASRGFLLDSDALDKGRLVEFVGSSAAQPSFSLRVIYPNAFPSKPPRVFSDGSAELLKRHHRRGTNEICTFGPGQTRWSATLDGTYAVDEADRVIADFSDGNDRGRPAQETPIPDDVPEPASAQYVYATATYILVPPLIHEFAKGMESLQSSDIRLTFVPWGGQAHRRSAAGRGVICEIGSTSSRVIEKEPYLRWLEGQPGLHGSITRLPSPPPPFEAPSAFRTWLHGLGLRRKDWMAFVFPEQSRTAHDERLGWLVIRSNLDYAVEPVRTFALDNSGRNVRMPGLQALPSKNVVLIGCGSMGSKIGASLASAGVGTFGLVDCDFIEPDNAVRHELGVDLFGVPKVIAVGERLLRLNPSTWGHLTPLDIQIGGVNEPSKEVELYKLLSTASLVIETTGDHGVSRFVNDLCGELGTPQLYASVTNGAWGGEVVRVIPGRTACWMCWYSEYESSLPPAEPSPPVGIFAPGCDQPTFTGTGYDIGVVASLASAVAVDTLLFDDDTREHFAGHYLRWAMRNNDGGLQPSVTVLPTSSRTICPFCHGS